jgi:hypothetical protein
MSSNRVTTKEFYEALLDITPQLKLISASLHSLQEWATGDGGVDEQMVTIGRRIQRLEERQLKEDTRRRTMRNLGKGLQAFIYIAISLLSALIGSTF